MKNLYKNILSVSLLMCFALSASAQVTQIFVPENNPKSNVKPKIIIEDNQLFAITSSGVYSQHLDNSGNLTAKTLLPCEFFTSFDYEVQDLAVKGDTIYVATTNYFQDKNAILASYDRGETWIDLDTWEGLGEFYNHQPAIRRGEIGNTNEIIVVIGSKIFYTSDFGKTWECKGENRYQYIKAHPLDSKISIARFVSWTDQLDNIEFKITYDFGQTWQDFGDGFIEGNYAAFHYSDSNIIVAVGTPTVVSKDCGKTFEYTRDKWSNSDDVIGISRCDFDTRGSNRLYGVRNNLLLYSDDFGASWKKVCKIGNVEADYIRNFTQKGNKIYAITDNYKAYQIDLSLLEASIDAVSAENMGVTLSVVGDMLKVNAETPVTNIEVYNISGIKLLSQVMTDGAVDIANLLQGTYVARLQTADGRSLSVKFNK